MLNDLKRLIDQVSRDKGVDRQVLIATLEEAIKSAAKKKLGPKGELEVAFNEDLGEMEVFQFKMVVEEVTDPHTEISLKEGRKLDPDCELGDSLGTKMDTAEFGRIAAQSAKQVIIQRMKEAERDVVYEDFKDRQGEIINGIVQRFDKGNIIVNLGRAEAVLPQREQVPREGYRQGDRLRAYVLEVRRVSKGPQIVLSRAAHEFILALFALEVPEIAEGIVRIMDVAREPGHRTKISVISEDHDIDPVGACVGMKGSRVQAVVQELRGEKIDIIAWSPDPAKYVCNALAPAEISRVVIDKANQAMEVVVPDEHLSLAIGRQGQNVRLASKLTGWKLDVVSETKYKRSLQEGYDSLLRIAGVGEVTADVLYEAGYNSADEVASASVESLAAIPGLSTKKAENIIKAAVEIVAARAAARAEEARERAMQAEAAPGAAGPAEATAATSEGDLEGPQAEVTESPEGSEEGGKTGE